MNYLKKKQGNALSDLVKGQPAKKSKKKRKKKQQAIVVRG